MVARVQKDNFEKVFTLFFFLVACFAAELFVSIGRTKDRASQISQGLNPLFAQLHPDLLNLPVTVKSLRVMRLKNLLYCPLDVFKATIWPLFS